MEDKTEMVGERRSECDDEASSGEKRGFGTRTEVKQREPHSTNGEDRCVL